VTAGRRDDEPLAEPESLKEEYKGGASPPRALERLESEGGERE